MTTDPMKTIEKINDPEISDDEKGTAIRDILINPGRYKKHDLIIVVKYLWNLCFEENIRLREKYKRSDTAAGEGK